MKDEISFSRPLFGLVPPCDKEHVSKCRLWPHANLCKPCEEISNVILSPLILDTVDFITHINT